MKQLAKKFGASMSNSSYKQFQRLQQLESKEGPDYIKTQFGLKRKPSAKIFKTADPSGRIFPGYFLPGLINHKNSKIFFHMRYRIRPSESKEEIPSKYNVFNARSDSLTIRKTWRNIFLKKHALVPFRSFFEWVEHDGKKMLIRFFPENKNLMWAPALFDSWRSPDGKVSFLSCAIITSDPPLEVLDAGHDRCPIFLREKHINTWLNTDRLNEDQAFQILSETENVKFSSEFVDLAKA